MDEPLSRPFVYDSESWGIGILDVRNKNLAARKLSICLRNLDTVRGRVLEVGCARGQFIRSIKRYRPDFETHGCDINERAVALNALEDPSTHYFPGSATALPFSDRSIDAVVFFDLLEHLENPDQFIREVFRILKKGGRLHGYVPCEGQPGTLHWLLWKLHLDPDLKQKHRGHIQRFTNQNVLDLVSQTGLVLKEVKHSGYFFEQLLDLAFYFMLEVKSLNERLWRVHSRMSELNSKSRENNLSRFLSFCRDMAFGIGFYETTVLGVIPTSLGVHVTAVKG